MLATLALLGLVAFISGLIDAAVGGGGLIQIPGLFNILPNYAPATLFGTNKFSSVCGTTVAARHYASRVKMPWALVLPAAVGAFVFSFVGASAVSMIKKEVLKPLILVLLIAMTVYTFIKKDFGHLHKPSAIGRRERVLATVVGCAIGFYDGLFGPGTGSFLAFLFIRFFAFDFLHATAAAKIVNLATNIAALSFFIPSGNVLWQYALPMGVCNMLGGAVGSRLAVRGGAKTIRVLFLALAVVLIGKFGYDLLK